MAKRCKVFSNKRAHESSQFDDSEDSDYQTVNQKKSSVYDFVDDEVESIESDETIQRITKKRKSQADKNREEAENHDALRREYIRDAQVIFYILFYVLT